jgi:hypothetical protein
LGGKPFDLGANDLDIALSSYRSSLRVSSPRSPTGQLGAEIGPLKEHYHGGSGVPAQPRGQTQILCPDAIEATIGDYLAKKPPGGVSETLILGEKPPPNRTL